jgi:mono/diheme cytochrome c family protein
MHEREEKGAMVLRRAAAVLLLLAATPALSDTADQRSGPFALSGGEALYRGICQGCHMADAMGVVGAGRYPALASNPRLADAGYVMRMVVKGQGGMPGFGDNLTDQQVADVVNYVRGHFGNHFSGAVTPAEVKPLR